MFGIEFYNNFSRNDCVYVLIIETDGIIKYHVFNDLFDLRTYVTSTYFYTPCDINYSEADLVMNLDKPSFSFNQFHPDGEISKVTITVRTAPFTQ